jgi:hypothetical protein
MKLFLFFNFKKTINMNRLKFLLATFVIAAMTLGIYSCDKDEVITLNKGTSKLQSRTTLPTVINGMLHFDTYSEFEDYIQELQELEQDTNHVQLAYQQLGVDLSQELLPNLTFFPVSLRMEQQMPGFTSARKMEENLINAALDVGDTSVFSIISEPYLKSALNMNHSVHIGTRIFKFYENEGLLIILNNDWDKFNTLVSKAADQIISGPNVVFTNRDYSTWEEIYEYDTNGLISGEKDFDGPTVTVAEAPSACDFSDALRKTDLGNGKIRIELPSNDYDIYEWTFEDGSKAFGNPLIIDCSQRTSGMVRLDVWLYDSTVPAGKRRICTGWMQYTCKCGERKSIEKRYQSLNAGGSGKAVRIEASLWVRAGQIGCRSNLYARGAFGIWYPMNWVHTTNGVCVDIQGSIKREQGSGINKECITVNIPLTTKCLQNGQSNASISQTLTQTGEIFHHAGQLNSGQRARLKTGGTWFGFGEDVPRLVLD